jgi:hypothetical protein
MLPTAPAAEPAATPTLGRNAKETAVSEPQRVSERQPLLLGARLRFVSESLTAMTEQDKTSSEGAFQDVFGEISAIAAREIVPNRWWGTLQTGVRPRNGPTTEFARLAFDLPPQPGQFGVDLSGALFSQSFGTLRTTTYSTTGRISRIWRLSQDVAWLPQVGFTTMRLGTEPLGATGVDGDVYSNFYATHPLSLRPFVDTLFSGSLSARTLPGLDGFDRLTGTLEFIAVPVGHWPLLGTIDWMSSYRPASHLRDAAFVRHDLGIGWSLWHWLTPNERVRLLGRVDFFFDAPSSNLKGLVVAPTVALEIISAKGRGLRDFSPQQAPFREFQEHGSSRIRSGRVGEPTEPSAPGGGS